jgi:hypothetical protein
MSKHVIPCLSSLKIGDLNKLIPDNVYVHSIDISYCRTHMRDKPIDTDGKIKTFKIWESAKTLFIPKQTVEFSSPIYSNLTKPVEWNDFIDDLNIFYQLATEYDPTAYERTYVGDIVLLEIPTDYIGSNKWEHTPLDENDPLYDGVWCKFGYFLRNYKVLGASELGDILAGCTKPADLVQIDLVLTKRTSGNLRKTGGIIRCFHTGNGNRYAISEKDIVKNVSEEWIKANFPSLYDAGILNIRQCEGHWQVSKSFRAESCSRLGANIWGNKHAD